MDKRKIIDKNNVNIDDDDDENIKNHGYFGIRSYLHNFYENVSVRNPNDDDDDDDDGEHLRKFTINHSRKKLSKLWLILLILGTIIMLIGIFMIAIGFTINRMQIDIGYQEEMRIIDKSAFKFNQHLEQIKYIGLIFFAIGGLILSSSLLLPSLLSIKFNDDSDDNGNENNINESTHLKFNINADIDDGDDDNQVKNLIPVREQLENVQPKQWTTNTIITNN